MSKLKKALLSTVVLVILIAFSHVAAHANGEKAGEVNCSVLNVRQAASTTANILDRISRGTRVMVLETSQGWHRISYNGVKTGWVSSSFISIKQEIAGQGIITGNLVNIRYGPGTSYGISTTMRKGGKAGVFGRYGDWYKVKTPDNKVGWVIKSYFSITSTTTSRGGSDGIPVIEPSVETAVNSALQDSVINYARGFLGTKYVYGGQSPRGFDCSGFAQYVFRNFGISLQRVAADQAKQGTAVSRSELRTGDLVFFHTNIGGSYINHVGIFIGNGKFIHASNPRYGVTITDMAGGFYYNNFVTARRVIN